MIRLSRFADVRLPVLFRVVAGTLGAYGLTALATVTLSAALVVLGMDRVEAVFATTTASFILFAIISIMAFHAKNVGRTWIWLVACASLTFVGLLLVSGV